MGLDLLVLADIEWNGIKFNVKLCKQKATETQSKLTKVTEELLKYSPTPNINLDSGQHLSCLLYGGKIDIDFITQEEAVYKSGTKKGISYLRNKHNVVLYNCPPKFVPLAKTQTVLRKKIKRDDGTIEEIIIYETNEGVLRQLKTPTKEHKRIIQLLLERSELAKLMDTYFGKLPELLEKMSWGEFLHGQYNQVVARTGRLSSSQPNMQNFADDVDQLLITRY
jgi:DNA polymerase I-like protein with 3'-5' exonuclease and polymerase domains